MSRIEIKAIQNEVRKQRLKSAESIEQYILTLQGEIAAMRDIQDRIEVLTPPEGEDSHSIEVLIGRLVEFDGYLNRGRATFTRQVKRQVGELSAKGGVLEYIERTQ